MSFDERQMNELSSLCDALLDGTLTEEQNARLASMLGTSESARQCYIRHLGLSASLFEYAAELQFPNSVPRPIIVKNRRNSIRWWMLAGFAAAAAIFIAVVLHGWSGHDAEADAEEFAAQITGLQECTWADLKQAPALGDPLPHGRQLALASGVAEITFDSGAQVFLEGPATLNLDSAWEATLQRGKLRATVPAEAVGFAIQSGTVDVVDLGTEFGMTVDASGATDVCVLQGSVEVTPRLSGTAKPEKFVLNERHARRFSRGGSEEIKNAASIMGQFINPTKLQRLAKGGRFVHWSFDHVDGRTARADGTWSTDGDQGGAIELSGRSAQNEPLVDGRWSKALEFDGQLRAQARLPGISDFVPHTVSFWVRIPAEAPLGASGPMIAWLAKAQDAVHVQSLQVTWNSNPAQGPVGALRTEIGRASTIGTTDLRDGRWHHVALIFVPKSAGKLHWHIRQYVDGHLETLANRVLKAPRLDLLDEPADDIGWLGSAAWKSLQGQAQFQGKLDELLIVDGALAPLQIRQLFLRNMLITLPHSVDD